MPSIANIDQSLFDEASAEHITITADEPELETEPVSSGNTKQLFSQTLAGRDETRTFSIDDQQFLTVEIERARPGNLQYQFNVAFLDATPRRFSGVAWRWLYAAVGLAVLSAISWGLSWYSSIPLQHQSWLPVSVLLLVATVITGMMFVYKTHFTVTFYSIHGGAPLLELAAHSPGRPEVELFVQNLQRQIEAARIIHWQNRRQFLRDELRLHCRLWEQGVLADPIYEASKVRILGEHG